MSIFQNPSAHNVVNISARSFCFDGDSDPACKPFASISLNMTSAKDDIGFFQIFGPPELGKKFQRVADAINAEFAEAINAPEVEVAEAQSEET